MYIDGKEDYPSLQLGDLAGVPLVDWAGDMWALVTERLTSHLPFLPWQWHLHAKPWVWLCGPQEICAGKSLPLGMGGAFFSGVDRVIMNGQMHMFSTILPTSTHCAASPNVPIATVKGQVLHCLGG